MNGANLPMPQTVLVTVGSRLESVLDGEEPDAVLVEGIRQAAQQIGLPCFIRTDIMSAKHQGPDACRLIATDKDSIIRVLYGAAEAHGMAFLVPDPRAILVREWLTMNRTAFHEHKNMGEEYRVFVEDDAVVCAHPYWPQAPELYGPDVPDEVRHLASLAGARLKGAWSIDFAITTKGPMLIDCAAASRSWHWEGCVNENRWPERGEDM
ncbi:MAG: ATP-grasp domain-containing protein [Gemmatimonadaceae bacterium]|nr:ATP-grasp domain-containing protein [Gemmatimonadaceae bacterium]